jgi:hypothetical protein
VLFPAAKCVGAALPLGFVLPDVVVPDDVVVPVWVAEPLPPVEAGACAAPDPALLVE